MLKRLITAVALGLLLAPLAHGGDQPEQVWVVVHTAELSSVANQWSEYRRQRGWSVENIDLSALVKQGSDSQVTAIALQAELRRRFAEAQSRGVRGGHFAVLLLGPVTDADGQPAIPTWHRPQHDPELIGRDGLADIATDLNYQLADDRDDLPDFMLGRVPARTPAEAMAALDKVQRYETQAPPGPWRRRLTYLAGEGGFGAIDTLLERLFIRMVDQIVPYDFDIDMTYANPRSPYCAPPSRFSDIVLDRLSEGTLLVNYMGHGHVDMLDRFTLGDQRFNVCSVHSLEDLTDSGNRLPIALLVACWTGRVDLPDDRRGLAEMMLFNRNGPVAVIAATRITHPYANALVQKSFTQQLCEQKRATVGAAHLATMRSLAKPDEIDRQLETLAAPIALVMKWATSPADLRLMHIGMYTLLGDPATRIAYPPNQVVDWTFDPITARASGTVPAATKGEVLITIETQRETIARPGEMQIAIGVGGAVLDMALNHNYALANDKVLWRTTVPLQPGGRFDMALPRAVLDQTTAAWVKAYVTATDATGAVVDACASAPVRSGKTAEPAVEPRGLRSTGR